MTISRLGRKGFILLAVAVHHRGKPRQEVKQELMQRPRRNAAFYLLLRDLLNLLSQHKLGWNTHNEPATSVRKWPTDLPIAKTDGGIFSIVVPSSQVTLACVGVDRKPAGTLWVKDEAQ